MQNTPPSVVLGIDGKAYLNLFLHFLWDVTAFGVHPCRSRAEQRLLWFYRVLAIKWAMHTYVYTWKKTPKTKGTSFVKKRKAKIIRYGCPIVKLSLW